MKPPEESAAAPPSRWLQRLATSVQPIVKRLSVPVVALAVCVVLLMVFQHLSHAVDYASLVHSLRNLSPQTWAASLGATVLSFLALIGRDAVGLRYVAAKVPVPALVIGATVGSALGNVTGFGALTGGAIRVRIYGSAGGVKTAQVGRLTVFTSIMLAVTLALMTGVGMLGAASALSPMFRLPPDVLRAIGAVIVLAFAGMVAVCRATPRVIHFERFSWLSALKLEVPSRKVLLAQTFFSVMDVVTAGLALWVILPHVGVNFLDFTAIYAAALLLGMIGHTPGGVGIFEAAMIFALGHNVPLAQMLAALLAYRAIYFIAPLVVSAALLAAFEGHALGARFGLAAVLNNGRMKSLAPLFLGLVTFAVGSMLVFSGATPAYKTRLAVLSDLFPLWVLEGSQLLGSVMGVFLLFVARGLVRQLDGAWWCAVILITANLAFSLTKGLAFVEAGVLALLLIMLIATRRQFSRSSSLFAERFTPGWLVSVGIVISLAVWMMFFAFRNVPYSGELWWGFAFDERAPRALRATLGAGLFAAGIAVWQMLRPAAGRFVHPPPSDLREANLIIRAQARSDAGLAMMGDKSFLFSSSRQAFLMYAKRGRTWAALYDPVGPREEWAELIRSFVAMAHTHGGRAAFYQVRADALPLYLDSGLTLMKLGEEAQIGLNAFSLVGPNRAHLRYAIKRGERDGLTAEFLETDEVRSYLPTLRRISNDWLDSRSAKEKSFSVAAFMPDYMAAQKAVVILQNGIAVAFATVMTTDLNTEATVGVMRHSADASAYTMEYLFTKLALHLKDKGFQRLSLGVSPFSGLQPSPLASPLFRLASLTWQFGNRFYNFRGLRAFKNKFEPDWEPRYLAASGSVGMLFTLADLSLLAGGWRS